MSTAVAVQPIGAYRIADYVCLFLDDPKGWSFFTTICSLPDAKAMEIMRLFIADALAMGDEAWLRPDGTMGSIIVKHMSKTTLPPDFPELYRVGIGPKHKAEDARFGSYVPAQEADRLRMEIGGGV